MIHLCKTPAIELMNIGLRVLRNLYPAPALYFNTETHQEWLAETQAQQLSLAGVSVAKAVEVLALCAVWQICFFNRKAQVKNATMPLSSPEKNPKQTPLNYLVGLIHKGWTYKIKANTVKVET